MIGAVLTGDIVNSSSMSDERLKRVRSIVLNSAEAIAGWQEDLVAGDAEFFRGDSWQVLLTQPGFSLRAATFVRTRLLASETDSRISVGIGDVSTIDKKRISLSSGEAFTLSGQALDALKRSGVFLVMSPRFEVAGDLAPAVFDLCNALVSGWTTRQCEIAGIALDPEMVTQSDILDHLGESISVQSVGKTLRSMSFDILADVLTMLERGAWLDEPR